MDEQPDILSFEPRPRRDGPGRGISRLAVVLAGLLVAGLVAGGYLAVAVTHRDSTIDQLRTALRHQGSADRQRRPGVPDRAALLNA